LTNENDIQVTLENMICSHFLMRWDYFVSWWYGTGLNSLTVVCFMKNEFYI